MSWGKTVGFCNFDNDDLMSGEWWTPKGLLGDKLLLHLRQWSTVLHFLLLPWIVFKHIRSLWCGRYISPL